MSKMVYEQPVREHSSGSIYRLFMESDFYMVWVKNSGGNWKVRVDAKKSCTHAWAPYTANIHRWTCKNHKSEYCDEYSVAPKYYVIEVDNAQLRSVLGDIVSAIMGEYGGHDYLEVK